MGTRQAPATIAHSSARSVARLCTAHLIRPQSFGQNSTTSLATSNGASKREQKVQSITSSLPVFLLHPAKTVHAQIMPAPACACNIKSEIFMRHRLPGLVPVSSCSRSRATVPRSLLRAWLACADGRRPSLPLDVDVWLTPPSPTKKSGHLAKGPFPLLVHGLCPRPCPWRTRVHLSLKTS